MYFIPFFSPMRYAAAGGREIKSPSNRNIPTLTGDVIINPINPENPDSKPMAAKHIISSEDWRDGCFWGMFWIFQIKVSQ